MTHTHTRNTDCRYLVVVVVRNKWQSSLMAFWRKTRISHHLFTPTSLLSEVGFCVCMCVCVCVCVRIFVCLCICVFLDFRICVLMCHIMCVWLFIRIELIKYVCRSCDVWSAPMAWCRGACDCELVTGHQKIWWCWLVLCRNVQVCNLGDIYMGVGHIQNYCSGVMYGLVINKRLALSK